MRVRRIRGACVLGLALLWLAAAAMAQTVTLSPTSLSFGNVVVGTTSAVKKVTLTNTGSASLTISSIVASADFAQTNTCGSSVGAGKKCTISVTFTPPATGTVNGTVTINDNAGNSPQIVSATGIGVAAVTLAPTSLTFASRTVGTTSNPISVTLTNNLSTTLSITTVAVSGDFAQTNTCGTSVASKGKCTISVTFTPTVVGTRTGTLTVTDNASNSPQTASLSGTGSTAGLTSIAVTPANPSAPVGTTEQFHATGTFTGGNTYDLTQSVTWSSSSATVATISNTAGTQGLATALTTGTSTIKAVVGRITGSTLLTVSPPALVSITVTPATPSIAVGTTQQFTATGNFSDGSTQNLTNSVTWTSSAANVATISSAGLASSSATGTTTISATSGSVAGSTTLTVTPAVLASIAVTPANPSFALGTTQVLIATGTYSDGSTLVLTTSATWSSANTSIATVSSQGVASSVAVGSTTVTATSGTIAGSTSVTVTPATLVSIAVTPAVPSLPAGTTQQFTATGTYSDASTQNITSTVQWSSDTPAVATISNAAGSAGLATGVASGTATISASSGSITGSTVITVTAATLVSIAVTPSNPSIALGTTQLFAATGNYSDGTTQNLTGTVTWASDTPSVATISNTTGSAGLATSAASGTATISATFGSIVGSTVLTVTPATLVSIAISPSSATIPLGATQQFTATGTYSDGTTQDLTQTGYWTSTAANVATISDSPGTMGLATSTGIGTTSINITSGSVTGSATLMVNAAALVSIAVTPQNPTIDLGATEQFTATGTYTNSSTQDLTSVATWSSSSSAVAVISASGLATSSGQGTTTISATSAQIAGSTSLTVSTAGLVSIAVTPANPTISVGATQQFTATGNYADGSSQNITAFVTWSSDAPAVATISNTSGSNGLASGIAAGTANITAVSGSITSLPSMLTVIASGPTLTSITVAPATASIPLGTTQQFTATGNYSDGSTQNLTATATWNSTNAGVATVSQGLASSVAQGTTSITASSGTITGSASLTVTAPNLVSIAITPQSPTISTNATEQFAATGTYTDKSTQNLTTSVTWTSGTLAVATISNSAGTQGLATGVSAGTSTITGSDGSVSSSTVLTVNAATSSTWTLHGPIGRHLHSAVWDPNSKQMIIFGGEAASTNASLNDVWLGVITVIENDSFTAESPTGQAPPGRFGHVATYDAGSNRMTVFAGNLGGSSCANDVWILAGANNQSGTPTWISATPSGSAPTPRASAGGGYDPNTNSMIVFGGNNCTGGFFNDVWVLSNANGEVGTSAWTQLSPSGNAPPSRESASVVYDSTHNILIVYAGDAGGSSFGDVWTLSNANGTGGTPVWTQLLPTGNAPLARTGHTATFDSATDRMTIFGGVTTSGATLNDAWVLTAANGIGGTPAWTQIPTQGTAPSLSYHAAVYDSAKNNMYVFGGISSQNKLQANNYAFALSGANGITQTGEKWTLGGPPVRYSHSAFYDSVTDSLFVFGGQHASTNTNFGDYWQASAILGSTNIQWTLLSTKGTSRPSSRFGHTGLYDSASNRMMVFGGAKGFPAPCVNDYWVMQQANTQGGSPTWVAVTPTGTAPLVRTRHASVYDSGTNTLIIFGGYSCAGTYYNDVWILTNANDVSGQPAWMKLQTTGQPPPARESSTAIYDPTTNSLIVYGGDAGGTPFGDLWILSNANGTGGTPAWTQFTPSNSGPVARSGHTATYDSVNNIMTIFGGYDGANILNDTWALSAANGHAGAAMWTQMTSGPFRRFHTSEYNPATNQLITFGGTTGTLSQDPSSDIYTLSDANDVP